MTARRSLVLGGLLALLAATPTARAQSPEPYRDPPFECTVIDYGTEAPPVPGPADDPLCVRYDKTNITVSTLEAIEFLAAEPGRVAIVAAKCSYWQQDHWVIRASAATPPLVSWEGSYWYDAPSGSAAGILRNLRVADQPADAPAFLDALRPIVGDDVADQLGAFADAGGGGGARFALPEGFGGDPCARSAGPPPEADAPDPDGPDPAPPPPPDGQGTAAPTATGGALPATGWSSPVGLAPLLVVLAIALRRLHGGAA